MYATLTDLFTKAAIFGIHLMTGISIPRLDAIRLVSTPAIIDITQHFALENTEIS